VKQREQPNFGPYRKWPAIKEFSDISAKAFEIYHKKLPSNILAKFTPTQHLFARFLYAAETTSFSIRLLTSWRFLLQALALARVRLEQTIVSSYLIHEKQEVALDPFVRYVSIGRYRHAKAAVQEPLLAVHLPSNMDIEKMRLEAVGAQQKLDSDFEPASERFQRKWTKLELLPMAQRRDMLATRGHKVSSHRLELDYLSLYKAASSIVHSDCDSLSYNYLDIFFFDKDQTGILMPKPSWAVLVASFCAHHDIVQLFEILNWLRIESEAEYVDLGKQWSAITGLYIADKTK